MKKILFLCIVSVLGLYGTVSHAYYRGPGTTYSITPCVGCTGYALDSPQYKPGTPEYNTRTGGSSPASSTDDTTQYYWVGETPYDASYVIAKIKTFCSPNGDITKCKKYCKAYDNKHELCKSPNTSTTPQKADPLAQQKTKWGIERATLLEQLKSEKETLRNEFKDKLTEEKCAQIQKKISEKSILFLDTQKKHTDAYTEILKQITDVINEMNTQKLDASILKNHLVELQNKIGKFTNDSDAYTKKLDATKNLTCGHVESDLRGSLLEARALLKVIHTDTTEIKTYIEKTISEDVGTLESQALSKNEDTNIER